MNQSNIFLTNKMSDLENEMLQMKKDKNDFQVNQLQQMELISVLTYSTFCLDNSTNI